MIDGEERFVAQEMAHKRWCPFVTFGVWAGGASAVSVSRHPEKSTTGVDRCLGYGCMAWVEHPVDARKGRCGRVGGETCG